MKICFEVSLSVLFALSSWYSRVNQQHLEQVNKEAQTLPRTELIHMLALQNVKWYQMIDIYDRLLYS